jgi:hypothetical protein
MRFSMQNINAYQRASLLCLQSCTDGLRESEKGGLMSKDKKHIATPNPYNN